MGRMNGHLQLCARLFNVFGFTFGLLNRTCAINLDLQNPTLYPGPQGSYFGFSVDFHQNNNGVVYVVVGAPKANTSQSDVIEGGSVFLCPWSRGEGSCQAMHFDSTGDLSYTLSHLVLRSYKSHQWFGATVRSEGNHILACAPLYTWNVIDHRDESGKTPVGNCKIMDMKSGSVVDYSPCRSNRTETFYNWNSYLSDGRLCEVGFSSDMTKNGNVLLGAPGCYYFHGQIITASISNIFKTYNIQTPIHYVPEETIIKGSNEDEYHGYSVATGEFTGDSTPEYVVGAPNDRNTSGSVKIYKEYSPGYAYVMHTFYGPQVASCFGHTVAVTDVNNDGRDDILIGAPLFMDRRLENKLHEVGQVFLYLQRESPTFARKPDQTLMGRDMYGRFGSAIATMGDINQDGFNDIAVGAPFSGGQGRVFIFMGQSDGVMAQYAQLLESPFRGLGTPAAFGFALRGGTDIDANGYPDLIVGAWGESKVAVYRSLAVIRAKAQLSLYPDVLNPDLRNCHLPKTKTHVLCFTIRMCVSVSGRNIPQLIVLDTEMFLDRNKPRLMRRTLFLDSNQPQDRFPLTVKGSIGLQCKNFTAYLRDESEIKDKLSPIVISLNYSLKAAAANESSSPVAVLHGQTAATIQTRIILDCGSDNICIPELRLSANMEAEQLLIGDDNPVLLLMVAENAGEGAYETELHVRPPPHAHFQGIVTHRQGFSRLICTQKKENDTVSVVCDLGNPMKRGTRILAGLYFSVSKLEEAGSSVLFELQMKSKNSNNPNSNKVPLTIPVTAVATLELLGGSSPVECILPIPQWEVRDSPRSIEEVGPLVEHVYTLRNLGPGTVNAWVELDFPSRYQGEFLLYIFANASEEAMTCSTDSPDIDLFKLVKTPRSANRSRGANSPHHVNKRQAEPPETLRKETVHVNCSNTVCVTFRCEAVGLERGQSAVVRVVSRLWVNSFLKKPYEDFVLHSTASYKVRSMPYKIPPRVYSGGYTETQTAVVWRSPDGEKEVPVWWIIVAVIAGLILLALLNFICWKIGFFKRTRPPMDDSQDGTVEQNEYAEMQAAAE
ncbi:integrin alpha-IIb [Amia ocellicauda]|uniref:integrin alpha-IIb n=1 Tax=Amia ocellicauda TaxID=2972642 RepID=UPI00346497FE